MTTQPYNRAQVPAADGFGRALREHRERENVSQSRLADAIGADHSTLARLESGVRYPSRDMALKLADALHLSTVERLEFLGHAGFLAVPMTRALAVVMAMRVDLDAEATPDGRAA